ncbi:hypothetical protein DPEC_G00233260 [Dallia pectoralis]|uniref:Uncharacterized protein n=1 Tax=Dallia pectoralis TaxID=75939 RepID=A0ACC2FXJ4_DALPE|nr:hypothetical protein DPEC_G00233260 [Dallia pectoralis]
MDDGLRKSLLRLLLKELYELLPIAERYQLRSSGTGSLKQPRRHLVQCSPRLCERFCGVHGGPSVQLLVQGPRPAFPTSLANFSAMSRGQPLHTCRDGQMTPDMRKERQAVGRGGGTDGYGMGWQEVPYGPGSGTLPEGITCT